MILRKALYLDDPIITLEIEKDDNELPEYGDILSSEGEGIRVGQTLYDKYGIRTYEILERGLDDPWPDDE